MKTLKIITTLLALSFVLSSCEKVKDLVDTPLDFSLDETFNVVDAAGDYSRSTTINASDDGNISANLDNIKDYTVDKVTFTVSNVDADPAASVSNLMFTLTGVTSGSNVGVTISDTNTLETLQALGAIDLDLGDDLLEIIKAMLASGEDITVEVGATVVDGPATFDLTLSLSGTIIVGL